MANPVTLPDMYKTPADPNVQRAGLADWLFGKAEQPPADPMRSWTMTPPRTEWPAPTQIGEERAYGTPGPTTGTYSPIVTGQEAIDLMANNKLFEAKANPDRPLPANEADRLYAAQMASTASNIASLGYDPNRIISTPPSDIPLTIAGMYRPAVDLIWSSGQSATNPVHESIHRGLKMLRDQGPIELDPKEEENIVRAIMLRNYGPVEKGPGMDAGNAQVDRADAQMKDRREGPPMIGTIQKLEQAAAHAIAKRNMAKGPM